MIIVTILNTTSGKLVYEDEVSYKQFNVISSEKSETLIRDYIVRIKNQTGETSLHSLNFDELTYLRDVLNKIVISG